MSEKEFYNTSPRFFYHRLKGVERLQEIENNRWKWEMEIKRVAIAYAFNKNVDRIHQQKPGNLFPLPWDEKKEKPKIEDVKEWVKKSGYDKIEIHKF